jgi:GABA(A) receptor-associated protein
MMTSQNMYKISKKEEKVTLKTVNECGNEGDNGSSTNDSVFFRLRYPLEKRLQESTNILKKYPERIPVILNISQTLPKIDKIKYLVPKDLTLAQFIGVVRKRMIMDSEKAIYVSIDDTLPACSDDMISIYDKYKNEDGFLYLNFGMENTFG